MAGVVCWGCVALGGGALWRAQVYDTWPSRQQLALSGGALLLGGMGESRV